MKKLEKLGMSILLLIFSSCSSYIPMGFYCEDPDVQIYVDGEYVGTNIVNYKASKDKKKINVSCTLNGEEVYNRNISPEYHKKELFEINIENNYKYSSGNSKGY